MLELQSDSEVPEFQIAALDAWENTTAPCSEMPFGLTVECKALEPTSSSFDFSPSALVSGEYFTASDSLMAVSSRLCVRITHSKYTTCLQNEAA